MDKNCENESEWKLKRNDGQKLNSEINQNKKKMKQNEESN